MKINLIVAISENNVIGRKSTNDLPWPKERYPEDLAFFQSMTTSSGKDVVVMGSSTMNSIGRKLPRRRNIVISRKMDLYHQVETGIETYISIEEALENCSEDETVWIIGGGRIYEQSAHLADLLYITKIPEVVAEEDLVYFYFSDKIGYVLKETIVLSKEKNLNCYVYEKLLNN